MPFWNFIRDIFGGRNLENPENKGVFYHQDNYDKDNFKNPIWQNDEDDNDIDDFSHSRGSIHFGISSDPLEISRFFQSQIDDILKSFMNGFHNEDHNIFTNALPFTSPEEENLRNKMLKPDNDNLTWTKPKVDVDLDGMVTVDNFSNVWDQYNEPKSPKMSISQHIIGKSIRKEYVRKSDGTIEQKQIFRDSEGNEETIISQQIGDKMYTITTRKDKNGVETKTEDFVNIDESELIGKKWLPSNNSSSSHNSGFNYFLWKNFFKPDPKL